jgi:hypothetical protein
VNDNDFPGGALAYREYEVLLRGRATGSIAFTLGDMSLNTAPANFARMAGALAFGLISLADVPHAPVHPFIWTHDETRLEITVAAEEGDLSDELRGMIARYIVVFFAEIAPIAPELAGFRFKQSTANDNTVH